MISRSQLRPSAASASVRCVRPPSVFGLPLLLLLIRSVAVARAVWRFPDGGGGRDRGMVTLPRGEREEESASVAGALEQRAGSDVQGLRVAANRVLFLIMII